MDNQSYMQAFLEETDDNLQQLNELCLKLEGQSVPDDGLLATMFRASHTLKGMSATMGFTGMSALTHRLEDVLSWIREVPERFHPSMVDTLFAAIDTLFSLFRAIEEKGTDSGISSEDSLRALDHLMNRSSDALNTKRGPEANLELSAFPSTYGEAFGQSLAEEGRTVGTLHVEVKKDAPMKPVRALLISRAVEARADCLECKPDATVLEQGEFEDRIAFFIALRDTTVDELVSQVENVGDVVSVSFSPYTTPVMTPIDGGGSSTNTTLAPSAQKSEAKVREQTLRVPVERLNTFMNYLSELVIERSRLENFSSDQQIDGLGGMIERMGRIISDLQSSVMQMRMMPVDSLFGRFPRTVRDLAKNLNKKIRLELSGVDTELDRTLVDEMGEVLVHLIRNAADHGLEDSAVRLASGKNEEGSIRLAAYPSGDSVFIEVTDDGGGIDREKVLARAVSKGLVSERDASHMSDADVYDLLFASGFSTAVTVSDISGRGVGLDAVRGKVESLGGRLSIHSVLHKGTTFRVQLPLTLSIIPAVLVSVLQERFAFPLSSVEEVIEAVEADFEILHGTRVLRYREHVVPVLDLGQELFSQPVNAVYPYQLVICRENNARMAFGVSSILLQDEIVNKPLGKYLSPYRKFSGATILGDGNIALILNVHEWMQQIHAGLGGV